MTAYRFFHPVEVRYGDLDPQGHLNNARYLTYFEQARVHYFIQLGLFTPDQSFMDIGVILAEARVTFRSPVHFGDPVRAGVRTEKLGNKSLVIAQNLVHAGDGRELAGGSVVLVAYDYHKAASIPLPQAWREKIAQFEGLS
jgi:acyl-CoA thioester hydrolase